MEQEENEAIAFSECTDKFWHFYFSLRRLSATFIRHQLTLLETRATRQFHVSISSLKSIQPDKNIYSALNNHLCKFYPWQFSFFRKSAFHPVSYQQGAAKKRPSFDIQNPVCLIYYCTLLVNL